VNEVLPMNRWVFIGSVPAALTNQFLAHARLLAVPARHAPAAAARPAAAQLTFATLTRH